MSEASDPPRLSDPRANAPAGLRELFSRAERDVPTPAQMDRLAARLAPAFAGPAVEVAGPAPNPWLLRGLGVAGGVAAIGIAAWIFAGRDPGEPAKPVSPPAGAVSVPVVQAPVVTTPPSAEAQAPVTGSESAEAPAAAPASTAATRSRSQPSEAALLEQARRALAADPARALALTRQHQQRFPNGILNQEREVIAIEALRRLGKGSEAKDRAGSFEKQFPGSAHQRAIESGGGK